MNDRPVVSILDDMATKKVSDSPVPLPKLPDVPAFPLEVLPQAIRPYIEDSANRTQAPPDFVAVSSMVSAGAVIGRRIAIRPKQKDNWEVYPNLWGLAVGDPGSMKSTCFNEGMKGLRTLQVDADKLFAKKQAQYEQEYEVYELRKQAFKAQQKNALKKDLLAELATFDEAEPEAPIPRTYSTTSCTVEKLEILLQQNPTGLMIERDEMGSLLSELNDPKNAPLRGLMLTGWNGDGAVRRDTISRGSTVVPHCCLSVNGSIQPAVLAAYIRESYGGAKSDGMMERYQGLVWPDAIPFEYVDRWPDANAKRKFYETFEALDLFDPLSIGSVDEFSKTPSIRFNLEAQEMFKDWYTAHMTRNRQSGQAPALAQHLSKYPALVGKLALITHLIDEPNLQTVSTRTLAKSLAWLQFLELHAKRVYFSVDNPETGAAELLLARAKRGDLPSTFKPWEISRKCWHGLGNREAVKKACRLLCEHGYLRELASEPATTGRPPDPIYCVNPCVLSGG